MNSRHDQDLTQLSDELKQLRAELSLLQNRRRRVRWAIAGAMVALVSATAWSQTLVSFSAGSPAVAAEINANFLAVKTWIETKTGSLGSPMPGSLLADDSIPITKLDCPNATARASWGFCFYKRAGGTFFQAAAGCKADGARLCTFAELSVAHAVGYNDCDYTWMADRTNSTTAYTGYPLQTSSAGCGTAGVVSRTEPMSASHGAYCCR